MNDMAPRRMDGFARPPAGSNGRPPAPQVPRQPQPQTRPQPAQVRREAPVAPAAGPAGSGQQPRPGTGPSNRRSTGQPYQAPSREQLAATQPGYGAAEAQPKPKKKGGGWKVVLQFVIGLAVILIVAAAIVALYVRYYQ